MKRSLSLPRHANVPYCGNSNTDFNRMTILSTGAGIFGDSSWSESPGHKILDVTSLTQSRRSVASELFLGIHTLFLVISNPGSITFVSPVIPHFKIDRFCVMVPLIVCGEWNWLHRIAWPGTHQRSISLQYIKEGSGLIDGTVLWLHSGKHWITWSLH